MVAAITIAANRACFAIAISAGSGFVMRAA
jgi:hypothetical protein